MKWLKNPVLTQMGGEWSGIDDNFIVGMSIKLEFESK